jgi:hypothetical protein
MIKTRFKEGQCLGYGEQADKITEQLYRNTTTNELGDFLELEIFNLFFITRTYEKNLFQEPKNTATILDALNRLRGIEAKAVENIGYARSGLEMANKFLNCSDDYDNKEVIRGKKDLLNDTIEEIKHTQGLVDKLYVGLINAYKTESQFALVFDNNDDSNDSRDARIYSYVMKSLSEIKVDGELIRAHTSISYISDDNNCALNSSIEADDGRNFFLQFDFEKGVGWGKPSSTNQGIKISTDAKGVDFYQNNDDEYKDLVLERIFVEQTLRFSLAKLFKKLHKQCFNGPD